MEAVKIRNTQKQSDYLKVQVISRSIRVVIEPSPDKRGFRVAAQQYYPDCSSSWEVRLDGWRDTSAQWCATLEGAKRVFDSVVRSEQRFVEAYASGVVIYAGTGNRRTGGRG